MSLMSVRFIADAAAFLLGTLTRFAPKANGRFLEFPGDTRRQVIPTRHGAVSSTIYLPPGRAGRKRRCM